MAEDRRLRTLEDLLRVVRALAYEFNTDTVFIVGSQAILASMPDAPEPARVHSKSTPSRRTRRSGSRGKPRGRRTAIRLTHPNTSTVIR
ncbi:hypothetical protein SAMN05216367_2460 [Tardiphaga sp. OK245]|nr:hypothetical protein SAMN05216367_2460 [Tardiphaga sp. OK245]